MRPHLVGEVVAQRKTAVCHTSGTLGDACDKMIAKGRTSAVLLDDKEEVKGVLTENDFLSAMMDGTGRDLSIDLWMGSGMARLPESLLQSMSLLPSEPLIDAAKIMMNEAEKDSGHACHHVLVHQPGHNMYLLSVLDIAMALIGDPKTRDEAHAAHTKVALAMKQRGDMATCKLDDKLSEAYRIMFESRQNMVLVLDADADVHPGCQVQGVITTADVLRSFSESLDAETTTVHSWLQGLTASEHPMASQRCISETKSLSDAAAKMRSIDAHHLVVLAENQIELVGVISALDIACALGHQVD
eukprot:CAMPEP_0197651620 /NCGR_PEP_ID=MMETSP1338-20131121/33339_1 /TAXON_ID=43686 ORGANISM="Pelagodinium beii, Strain RCC1491" /NCGR_SAMPLE_ID=MMETSP1338 /ASSEMBLY_ACC=CAM_ASM_000754 /LENGTH=300 /DNA_ID=CAMNT_0043226307 /DNA_START=136 /DNA_END=1038 /DNA_ORIENTATION=+